MKALYLGMLLASAGAVSASLDEFQWKKRILVVAGDAGDVAERLAGETGGLSERDVEVFFIDGPGEGPGPVLEQELRERLGLRKGEAEVVLLGKDGVTTRRWRPAEFLIRRLYAAIDAMPMRREEMKERE